MNPVLLDSTAVRTILRELVEALVADGANGSVFVIGGAAMALLHDERRSTTDIDGWIAADVDASPAVKAVQQRWGLSDDWFNFHAKGLLPPVAGTDFFAPALTVGGVTLMVAEPAALLAMKLFAARGKDQDDIAFLVRLCGVTDIESAEAVLERYYPGDGLSARAIARLEAALG